MGVHVGVGASPAAAAWDDDTAVSFLSRHSSVLASLVSTGASQRPGGNTRTYAFGPPPQRK